MSRFQCTLCRVIGIHNTKDQRKQSETTLTLHFYCEKEGLWRKEIFMREKVDSTNRFASPRPKYLSRPSFSPIFSNDQVLCCYDDED